MGFNVLHLHYSHLPPENVNFEVGGSKGGSRLHPQGFDVCCVSTVWCVEIP